MIVRYGDKAYSGAKTRGYDASMKRAARGHPLGISDILRNKIISKERPPVERCFSDLENVLDDFAASILKSETELITADQERLETAFNYLVNFLMSFASRTGTRDRLQIFTTNYDRYIEVGAEVAGLHLLDRFVGSLASIFRSSRLEVDMHYNPPGIRGEPRYLEGVARFTKLHGSLDWVNPTQNIIRLIGLPFGAESIEPYLNAPGLKGATAMKLMIYPKRTSIILRLSPSSRDFINVFD